jgi:N-acetylglucosaminyldiphosphoundecaprenol N-acetyl-beta-D-mannosaminyltransferase
LDRIEDFVAQGTPHHVLTSDANAILTSRNDPEYAAIMRRAALITPDGFGVIWGARLLNLPIYERVTGVDMVTGICERAAKNGYRLFILGSSEGIAATAAANLMARYPGLQIVGTHHGFWRRDGKAEGLSSDEADAKMAQEIARQRIDVLFVAMGIPMQEKFIAAQLERLQVPVALGVGGSFDVYAGKFNRAPEAVQRLGLEWLYRVWIDPSRWKRMGYVPKFMVVAIKAWIFGPKNGDKATPGAS